jgi:hypothetical protein
MTFNPSASNQKIIDGVVVLSEFDPDSLGNPPADKTFLYAEDDGNGDTVLKTKNSSGTEKALLTELSAPYGIQPQLKGFLSTQGVILGSTRIDAGVPICFNLRTSSNFMDYYVSSDVINLDIETSTNSYLEINDFDNLTDLNLYNPHNNHSIDFYISNCKKLINISINTPSCNLNSFILEPSGGFPLLNSVYFDTNFSSEINKDNIYITLANCISTRNGTIDTSQSTGSVTTGSAAARATLVAKNWTLVL